MSMVHSRVLPQYLADMVTPYGVTYSEQRFMAGNHNSYAYLGERLLAELG